MILQWFQSFQMLHHRVDKPSWQIPFQHTIGTPVFLLLDLPVKKLSLHPKRPKIRASCSAMIQNTGSPQQSDPPRSHPLSLVWKKQHRRWSDAILRCKINHESSHNSTEYLWSYFDPKVSSSFLTKIEMNGTACQSLWQVAIRLLPLEAPWKLQKPILFQHGLIKHHNLLKRIKPPQ